MDRKRWPAAIIGGATGLGLSALLVATLGWRQVNMDQVRPGSAESVATEVFGARVLPFELLSVLLLSALVGAIAISTRRRLDR